MATRLRPFALTLGLLGLGLFVAPLPAQAHEGLEGDRLRTALTDHAADFWVYDDLARATKLATATGKPLLVSFRCVP